MTYCIECHHVLWTLVKLLVCELCIIAGLGLCAKYSLVIFEEALSAFLASLEQLLEVYKNSVLFFLMDGLTLAHSQQHYCEIVASHDDVCIGCHHFLRAFVKIQ